jgi:hypothetical protein
MKYNHIGSVMVSVFAATVVDRRFETPDRVKPKTIKLVFVATPPSTQFKKKEQRLVGSDSE